MKKLTATILLLAFVWIMALLLTGCASKKQIAFKYLAEHPQEAAGFCANTFPVKDSIGQPVTIVKADNKDYSGQVDSLGEQIDNLNYRLHEDSAKAAAGGQITAQELSNYKTQVSTLKKDYDALRRSYKPCQPEIQQIPIIRENTARVIELRLAISTLQDKYNDMEQQKKEAESTSKKRLWALIAAGVFIVILAYKLLKK